MSVTELPRAAPKPKRRRFQYSLRTLLVFVTLCAILCSWLAVKMRQAERRREAAEVIRAAGGAIIYEWEYRDSRPTTVAELSEWVNRKPPVPKWVTDCLGDDLFYNVAEVIFPVGWQYTAPRCDDDTIRHLYCLTKLKRLDLSNSRVTDEGVKKLQNVLPNCKIVTRPPNRAGR